MTSLALAVCALCVQVHLGAAPVAVTVGAGSVWALAGSSHEVLVRVDPGNARTPSTVRVGPTAYENGGIAVADGSVWAAFGPTLVRFDPGSGRVTATMRLGGFASGLAVAARDVWVVSSRQIGPGELVRIDRATMRVKARIRVGDGPVSVLVALGSVWVANSSNSSVMRIDPQTNRVVATLLAGRFSSDLVAAGRLVWVAGDADFVGLDRRGRILRRIHLSTSVVRVSIRGATAFATDNCGCRSGRIFRIDLAGGRVIGSYRVGMTPVGLTATPGAVWVADFGDSSLVRLAV